jgi:hypothetical protein
MRCRLNKLRSALVVGLIVGLVLVLGVGCASNRARADNDIIAHVELERQEVRRHGAAKSIDLEFTAELFSSGHFNRPEDFLVALMVFPIVAGIEVGIRSIGETTVYIEPEGYPEYRQRLWWGRNKVFFPAAVAGQQVPVKILFYGNYVGSFDRSVKVRATARLPEVKPSGP